MEQNRGDRIMAPAPEELATGSNETGRKKRVALYGLFGQQNWGNDCTLLSIVSNIRWRLPNTELKCICTGPDDVNSRYGIRAIPMSDRYARGYPKASASKGRLSALPWRIIRRTLAELGSWFKAYKALRGFDMLVVPGTGILTDFTSSPMGIPYRILKWSVAARLCRCKLVFLSIGAGPMRKRLTRWILRAALACADFRSYRDIYSKEFLRGIGFDVSHDPVYPDLAFSFPITMLPSPKSCHGRRTIVGVGVKDYYGKDGLPDFQGQTKYKEFIRKLAIFVKWLIENDYDVRLLIGDTLYDNSVKKDLVSLLEVGCDPVGLNRRLISEPISSTQDLLEQIAVTDIVISARYHNIVFGLLLGKPVMSLAYHDKFVSLMASVGLEQYCQDIDDLDVDRLIDQVQELPRQFGAAITEIQRRISRYRALLDEQYAAILDLA